MSESRPREAFICLIRAAIVGFVLTIGTTRGADFSEAVLKHMMLGSTLIGMEARRADDVWRKYHVLLLIDEALRVHRARDPLVDMTKRPAIWPYFDSRKLGYEKVVFAGSDPSGISDPGLQAAYRKALQDNFVLAERFLREFRKQEAIHHCLKTAHDVLQLIEDPGTRNDVLQKAIALDGVPLLKEIVQFGRMPSTPAPRHAALSIPPASSPAANHRPLLLLSLVLAGLCAWLIRRHFRSSCVM